MLRKIKDKDKIFLVFYIGIKGLAEQNSLELLNAVNRQCKFDDSIKRIFIPTKLNNEIKIECINPILLDKEQYKRIEDSIKKIENVINNYDKENI